MLWYDNTPQMELKIRIEKAANYYRIKYRRDPTLCLVHPDSLSGSQLQCGRLTVRANRSVLPRHFWIGVEDEK
jgi:hypothetical protein